MRYYSHGCGHRSWRCRRLRRILQPLRLFHRIGDYFLVIRSGSPLIVQHLPKYLTDPSWWFSTVIIGLLVSLLAAYLKDWISAGLSFVSPHYRKYRRRKLRRKAPWIQNIAADTGYMLIYQIRQGVLAIAVLLCFTTYLVATQHPSFTKPFWLSIG